MWAIIGSRDISAPYYFAINVFLAAQAAKNVEWVTGFHKAGEKRAVPLRIC
jgi:hypothetical protein